MVFDTGAAPVRGIGATALDATKGTNIEVVATKWGDTGRDIQLALLEDVLQSNPDIDFIVGNAQAAVSGVQAVREAGLEDSIKILAFHQNPRVYDGLAALYLPIAVVVFCAVVVAIVWVVARGGPAGRMSIAV